MFKKMMALIVFLGMSTSWAKEVMTLKDFLNSELSGGAKMSKETFALSDEQKKSLKSVSGSADENFTFYYSKSAEGKTLVACNVLAQEGKEGPMTVGVCFHPDGLIKSVKVLSHVEDRGKGVDADSFLKQFSGKRASGSFQVGKDVDGISGATISSKAVSEAVRRASFGFKSFVQK